MITGELETIARPYSKAVFELAIKDNALLDWEDMLRNAADLSKLDDVNFLLSNPEISSDQLADLFIECSGKSSDVEKTNFIKLLAMNNRLSVLPQILILFISYRLNYEKSINVKIVSAFDVSDSYKEKFILKLNSRLQKNVSLECEVDPLLLGGAIISAGDMVIDGSVRGKLNRLLESL
ncbi:F0F1 ATP synthase subunit delta [Gammaproteobacteria bacterium]|nr:F0F1 ATP synthase subunit delta [Gammaproteobacteria bacterium]